MSRKDRVPIKEKRYALKGAFNKHELEQYVIDLFDEQLIDIFTAKSLLEGIDDIKTEPATKDYIKHIIPKFVDVAVDLKHRELDIKEDENRDKRKYGDMAPQVYEWFMGQFGKGYLPFRLLDGHQKNNRMAIKMGRYRQIS